VTSIPLLWRLPFALAWGVLRAGSRPIGAVLYDPEGNAVAAGRPPLCSGALIHADVPHVVHATADEH
jgi:tRNA(Arg) A34 adenosine deaminase TadA